jgi:hypothetical protein
MYQVDISISYLTLQLLTMNKQEKTKQTPRKQIRRVAAIYMDKNKRERATKTLTRTG